MKRFFVIIGLATLVLFCGSSSGFAEEAKFTIFGTRQADAPETSRCGRGYTDVTDIVGGEGGISNYDHCVELVSKLTNKPENVYVCQYSMEPLYPEPCTQGFKYNFPIEGAHKVYNCFAPQDYHGQPADCGPDYTKAKVTESGSFSCLYSGPPLHVCGHRDIPPIHLVKPFVHTYCCIPASYVR